MKSSHPSHDFVNELMTQDTSQKSKIAGKYVSISEANFIKVMVKKNEDSGIQGTLATELVNDSETHWRKTSRLASFVRLHDSIVEKGRLLPIRWRSSWAELCHLSLNDSKQRSFRT